METIECLRSLLAANSHIAICAHPDMPHTELTKAAVAALPALLRVVEAAQLQSRAQAPGACRNCGEHWQTWTRWGRRRE